MRTTLIAVASAATIFAVAFGAVELFAELVRRGIENFEWRVVLAVCVGMPLAVVLGLLGGWAVWKRFEG